MEKYRGYAGVPGYGGLPPSAGEPVQEGETVESILAAISQKLGLILDDLGERTPQGFLYSLTELIVVNDQAIKPFGVGLFAVTVINDGPGVLQVKLPGGTATDWTTINVSEFISLTFPKGVLHNFQRRTLTNTTYRLYGHY